jgi:hypothetical protein
MRLLYVCVKESERESVSERERKRRDGERDQLRLVGSNLDYSVGSSLD